MAEIFHSSAVGGLVPLEGWYWQMDGMDELNGPFETLEQAMRAAVGIAS